MVILRAMCIILKMQQSATSVDFDQFHVNCIIFHHDPSAYSISQLCGSVTGDGFS